MKTSNIHVRVAEETVEGFKKICEREHRSQAQQIEYWVSANNFDGYLRDRSAENLRKALAAGYVWISEKGELFTEKEYQFRQMKSFIENKAWETEEYEPECTYESWCESDDFYKSIEYLIETLPKA